MEAGGINNFSQLEHVQAKYIGTGHSDTSGEEWLEVQQKDTLASFVGHQNLLKYVSVGLNETAARTRLFLLHKMLIPLKLQKEREPIYKLEFLNSYRQHPSETQKPTEHAAIAVKGPIEADEEEDMAIE